jgi:cytosine/creatinine deaminase
VTQPAFKDQLGTAAARDFTLSRVRAPVAVVGLTGESLPVDAEGLVSFDLVVRNGRISELAAPGSIADAVAGGDRLLFPLLADLHTHLDMGHVVDIAPNPEGTHFGAVKARDGFRNAAIARGEAWREADLEKRMEFALRCAEAHGTAALRTHLDTLPEQADLSWRVFARLRDSWQGRIALQGSALLPIDNYLRDYGRDVADRVAEHGGVLGAVTRLSGKGHGAGGPEMAQAVEAVFRLAIERDLDVDLHVDETGDPTSRCLDIVARAIETTGFKRTVVCGHCCSLGVRPDEETRITLQLCRDAGLAVVTLPHCNLYLQDRTPGRTPRWRGITLLQELRAGGTPVAIGTDNCRDYFYTYGDQDLLSSFFMASLIGQLDRPYSDWIASIAKVPADLMGFKEAGRLKRGGPASFILFAARRYSELLARPQADRLIVRNGQLLTISPPDYRELD